MMVGINMCGFQVMFIAVFSHFFAFPSTVALPTTSTPPPSNRQCIRAPTNSQPEDSYYRLGVSGDPDFFLPGEIYTISLNSVDRGEGPTPFMGFTIWAEHDTEDGSTTESPNDVAKPTVGSFQVFDAQTKLDDKCFPAVTNASAHPKVEVQVIWNPPPIAAETCIKICARAGPLPINASSWTVLARKLCAAPVAPSGLPRQIPVVEPCCACDEAKYEVTFEGLWSRNTHPHDFPPEEAQAHFGDIIGASHTAHYRVWQEGRIASNGLKRLADDGSTTALEKELKAESEHIRTIIKSRGISWQPAGTATNRSTFAVFRVDAKHHLVSLASKLSPSPDWFVGVSALELCNANCTWRSAATLPLYPYDAGTDSGVSYMSVRSPTSPVAAVRGVREWPFPPRPPSFAPTPSPRASQKSPLLRPFATLRLHRQRLYEKNCDVSGPEGTPVAAHSGGLVAGNTGTSSGGAGACSVGVWGAWGACSVTCGPGHRVRQRHYVSTARAQLGHCRVPLTEHGACYGPRRHCRAPSEYEPEPAESTGPCAVSPWSPWSPCSGCGVRARTRHYIAPRAHKRCHTGYRARTQLHQAMPCDAGPCHRAANMPPNASAFDWFFTDFGPVDCPVTSWSEWSPCSSRCGRGRRLRTRLYVIKERRAQQLVETILLDTWNRRFADLQGIEPKHTNTSTEDPALVKTVNDHIEKCQHTLTQQEALCDGTSFNCKLESLSKDICKLNMSVGPCRGYDERWFFDAERGGCEPFGYTGCGGNANNFVSRDACFQVCGGDNITAVGNLTESSKDTVDNGTRVARSLIAFIADQPPEDIEALDTDDVDCQVSTWLGWGHCNGNCRTAYKLNFRIVTRKPSGHGRHCPDLIKKRNCIPRACRLISSAEAVEVYQNANDLLI